MLEALYLLNSRGLQVFSEIFNSNKFFTNTQDDSNSVDNILISIYYELNFNFPENLSIRKISSDYKIPKGLFGYYFVSNNDLYIIFSNTKPNIIKSLLKDEKIKTFVQKRKKMIGFYSGLFVSDYSEQQGPVPFFNDSPISDEEQFLLAVQGVTVLGMGTTDTDKTQLAGPLPVPRNDKYSFLVFLYHRPAPDSEDPRIKQNGRPATIFMIVETSENIDKEVLDFTKTFLDQWASSGPANKNKLDPNDLKRLKVDIARIIQLARDLVFIRAIQESEFRNLLLAYSSENLLLKDQISDLEKTVEMLKESLSKYE